MEERDIKKRKIYDEVSEEGPLTQEDVKYFRKQAIWRQMKYYKSKHQENDRIVGSHQQQIVEMKKKLHELKAWKVGMVKRLKLDIQPVKVEGEDVEDIDDNVLITKLNEIISTGISEDEKNKLLEYSAVVNDLEIVNKENEILKQLNEELKLKFEETTNSLYKKYERETSESVKRVYNNDVNGEEDSNNGTNAVAQEPSASDKPNGTSETEEKAKGDTAVDPEEVKYLNGIISEYDAKLKQIFEENEKLGAEVKKGIEIVKVEIPINPIKNDDELVEKNKLIKQLTEKLENYSELINQEIKQENDRLRDQLSKNESDLVRIRNTRDELLNKINILERQKTNEELIKLNDDLLLKMKYSEGEANTNEHEIIKELEESYKKLVSEITVKVLNKVEQDNLIKKYQIEKTKADQKYFQIMKLKDNLINENKIMKLTISKSNELIEKNQDIEKAYADKLQQLQAINGDFQDTIHKLTYSNKKLNEETNLKLIEINKLINKITGLNEELKEKSQAEISLKDSLSGKEVELIKLTKFKQKVTSQAQNGHGFGGLNDNEEELQGYRSMVKCSVCSKNWKDTVITVCGHVFCQQCTKERLNARLRRCPTCNKGFSTNDMLSIHL